MTVSPADIISALKGVATRRDVHGTVCQLLGVLSRSGRLSQLPKPVHFKIQLESFVQIYLPDCPFDITSTHQYSVPEACVTARKPISRGEKIRYLGGYLVPLTEKEEQDLHDTGRNFSIAFSNRSGYPSLFLGPACFVNHDCDGNAGLHPAGDGIQIVATRYISIGEEVTVKYGNNYFGKDNCDCLCATCESMGRNGWAARSTRSVRRDMQATLYNKGRRLRTLRTRDKSAAKSVCKDCKSRRSTCSRCQWHWKMYGVRWPARFAQEMVMN